MTLAAAALSAGLVAVLVTLAVERWGGRIGGVLGSVPTTIVPHALGLLSRTADGASFRDALAMAPAGMLLNAGFLWLWRVLPSRWSGVDDRARLVRTAAFSLVAWFLAAAVVVALGSAARRAGLALPLLGWILTLVLAGMGILACRGRRSAPRGSHPVSAATLLTRAGLAATAIGGAGLLARQAPLLAGIAGVFPAIFLTTMIGLWLAQGQAVPQGAVGPMMLGSTSVAVFALLAGSLMPPLGPWRGAGGAWLAAVGVVTVPALLWQRHQDRSMAIAAAQQGEEGPG